LWRADRRLFGTLNLMSSKLEEDVRVCLDQIKSLEMDLERRENVLRDLSHKKQTTKKYDTVKRELVNLRDHEA
jgi:hypothetical protein